VPARAHDDATRDWIIARRRRRRARANPEVRLAPNSYVERHTETATSVA